MRYDDYSKLNSELEAKIGAAQRQYERDLKPITDRCEALAEAHTHTEYVLIDTTEGAPQSWQIRVRGGPNYRDGGYVECYYQQAFSGGRDVQSVPSRVLLRVVELREMLTTWKNGDGQWPFEKVTAQ